MVIVHGFKNGVAGTHAGNVSVNLRIGADAALGEEAVLFVEYPAPSSDPASRDVRLDAEHTDRSTGRALSFRIRPTRAIRVSVSFVDRNRVVYTSWTNLEADVWQTVRIDFAAIRPNPYFQPPDARAGAPLDVTEVNWLAFALQDPLAGRLAVTQIKLVQ